MPSLVACMLFEANQRVQGARLCVAWQGQACIPTGVVRRAGFAACARSQERGDITLPTSGAYDKLGRPQRDTMAAIATRQSTFRPNANLAGFLDTICNQTACLLTCWLACLSWDTVCSSVATQVLPAFK